jgi:hypothetical protein
MVTRESREPYLVPPLFDGYIHCQPYGPKNFTVNINKLNFITRLRIIVMRRLTTGIRSEKCVVRRFRRCANVIECTYIQLDGIALYTPRLYGIAYCS